MQRTRKNLVDKLLEYKHLNILNELTITYLSYMTVCVLQYE